ncbi:aminopeptidase N [Pseudomonadota bacterium]
MSNETPKTIYLKDYIPPPFLVDELKLQFELGETSTVVTSLLKMRRDSDTAFDVPLVLDGQELQLAWVKVNGETLIADEYDTNEDTLTLFHVPDVFELEIQTHIKPQENTSLEGLYKSSGNFCTQCEAEGFRKITYYYDRPDVMTLFTTTIIADKKKYPVMLSNGNLVEKVDLDDGRHKATWHDPFKKPCYLFALVAGQLECIEDSFTTMSGREVALQIFVEKHNVDKCEHAMISLKKSMTWDEEVYGREYDLDIYMIVAVDDFNMGAMENKGLNVFNSKYVLARPDTATDVDFNGIESVIAHEYFHNWSGNRVTCRDWFQLSLKEGFTVFRDQSFSADMFSHAVKRIEDVNRLRSYQFAEDGGPMSHPVRPASYVEINNFYTLTVYEKGAEVVRMIHRLMGEAGFRKGTDLYFERHDGQAVTTDDFVKAMEDANGADLTQFKNWYSQSGTPVLDCESSYDEAAQTYTLTIRQHCPPTPGQTDKAPYHIPVEVGLLSPSGAEYLLQLEAESEAGSGTRVLECKQSVETFRFVNVTERPVPSLLRHFTAPVKFNYDYSADELAFLMANDSDQFNRWNAGQQLALMLLHELIDQHQASGGLSDHNLPELYAPYSKAFQEILSSDSLELNFKAMALTLPSENYIAGNMAVVDPEAIHEARWFLRTMLAKEHCTLLEQNYAQHSSDSKYVVDADNVGRRAVRNVCLAYLSTQASSDAINLCYEQYSQGQNMTDVMAAMRCLVDIECDEREQALNEFYDKWKGDMLVVDKWLGLQAMSRVPNTLANIKALMNHEAFNIKNPNKVRALISSFVIGNAYRFHTAEGYAFLADQVIMLDKLNPQVAARLVSPLIQWRRYDEQRQALMKTELQRIIKAPKLSKDVYEVVSKGLA